MWPYDMNQGFPQMGGYGQQMGNGGFGQYQPQAPTGADQGNARIDKLKGRVSNLQEQMKGAGTQDMAGIQARMDKMQGRIKGLRADRRQGEGLYAQQQGGAQPEPGMMRNWGNMSGSAWAQGPQQDWTADRMRNAQPMPMGGPQYGGLMGGAAPWGGGMNFGGMQGGGMGGMGEGAFRGGYNPNQQGGGYSGDYQSQVGQYQQRLAQYQQQAAANGGNGGYAGPPAPPMGMYDNNGNLTQGANRPGMQYRQDRRQANRQQGGAEQGQMPQQQQAPQQQGGTAAMMPGNGGSWNPLTTPTGMGNVFDTGWGQLVPASGGNSNVFRRADGDDSTLYHFDPNAIGNDGAGAKGGWKSMSQDAYRGYGDYNYADPYNDPRAQARMQNWTKQNGLIQGQVGTGAYK